VFGNRDPIDHLCPCPLERPGGARQAHTNARNRVSILAYHDPSPDVFDRHLRFLADRYNVIALADLLEALGSEKWGDLPARPLVVTFDDGHRG
jgi:hypothetical protein